MHRGPLRATTGGRAWPAAYDHGDVGIRPLRLRDGTVWVQARRRNRDWLQPWEGAPERQRPVSWEELHSPPAFSLLLRSLRRDARAGRCLPFAVTWRERLVGQVTVGNIVRGAWDNGTVGYWVDREAAGRGVIPTAVAMAVDHAFDVGGLHRIEVNVRPENAASLRVVEKLGFRPEGRHEKFLYIAGEWRDHLSFALVRDDVPEGLLRRYAAGPPS